MHTRAFFHDLTFIILFAIVVFAIGTSLHTMCRTVSELDHHPTPAPQLKATSVAFL